MKTKKATKCFLRSVPGISYLTHWGHLSGRFFVRVAFDTSVFYPGGYVLILALPWNCELQCFVNFVLIAIVLVHSFNGRADI